MFNKGKSISFVYLSVNVDGVFSIFSNRTVPIIHCTIRENNACVHIQVNVHKNKISIMHNYDNEA